MGNHYPIGERYTRDELLAAFRHAFRSKRLPVMPKRAPWELRHDHYISCWCAPDQECHVEECIKAIEISAARKHARCPYFSHRLRNHYTIEMLNELYQVYALGAACPRWSTSEDPFDFLSHGLCLVLPSQ